MFRKPRLLDQVREAIRLRHYSYRTEQQYVAWIRRYILFHDRRHPGELGGPEVEAFLSHLATRRNVAAATQGQALAAILFLYKHVLRVELPWLDNVVRARRPKRCKLALNRRLATGVARLLRQCWSPWQIAGRLKRRYRHDESRRVSHETIYKTLFIQARGALKQELVAHLRRSRTMRRSRHHTQKGGTHGQITDAVSIRERPAEAEDRAVPGHWEGDLLMGSHNSQIATLVERHSRYVMLVRVRSKDTKTVIDALIKQAQKLPRELYKSLTWDRGKELADHKRFSLVTDIKVYFCDPQSPWQRGSNEQINGLLRQYFPKGMDLSGIHQNKLDAVARQLNQRPRQTLDFETPAERFEQCVASIG